jgi:hypothetical protein
LYGAPAGGGCCELPVGAWPSGQLLWITPLVLAAFLTDHIIYNGFIETKDATLTPLAALDLADLLFPVESGSIKVRKHIRCFWWDQL